MSEKKPKLELTWIGKDNRPRLEPRILLEDPELSYCAPRRGGGSDLFDNLLIQGDNLLALKALEAQYAGKVKCVCIDPPYNTGSAFEHYDDGVEHSLWLSMMLDRLIILRRLMRQDGSIWIIIGQDEVHYLKVLCDEVFGRSNFVANIVWQKRTSPDNRLNLGDAHDNILVYCKDIPIGRTIFSLLPLSADRTRAFRNPDNDPRGPWASTDCTAQAGHGTASQFYALTTPAGRVISLPNSLCWRFTKERMEEEIRAGRIWFGQDGLGVPRKKTYLSDSKGQNAWTWWPNSEVGHTQEAKKEVVELFGADSPFDTPKPERLIERIIRLCTVPGDLVLDSFAGSGTTGAVAHKLERRWILVELGEHARTHCLPRMVRVVDGTEGGGITEAVGWSGGGGFRFYRLAPSLLERDKWGNWVISEAYRKGPDAGARLAEAMCKLEGFRYSPSQTTFWQHGQSTEQDYIYVTTQTLTHEQLQAISEEVGPERTLLICCSAFKAQVEQFTNLTVKKIPATVLARCEWGKDDYSLNVQNVMAEEVVPEPSGPPGTPRPGRKKKPLNAQELPLFAPRGNK